MPSHPPRLWCGNYYIKHAIPHPWWEFDQTVFFSASYSPECIPCCTTRSYHFLPMCCLLHMQHVTTSVLWIWTHACANIIPKPVCRVLETRLVSLWPYLKIVGNHWTSTNMTPLLQIDYRQLFTQFITCNQMLQQYEHSSHACIICMYGEQRESGHLHPMIRDIIAYKCFGLQPLNEQHSYLAYHVFRRS